MNHRPSWPRLLALASIAVFGVGHREGGAAANHVGPAKSAGADWPVYGGSARSDRYSPLSQIDRSNVGKLKVAWRFDMREPGDSQTSPLVVDGTLYAYTPDLKVIALDAAKGELRWKFEAGIPGGGPHRGLAYWSDGKDKRLLAGATHFLYALDPADGNPIATFGEGGRIDLRKDLGRAFTRLYVSLTTPGVVYKDLVIVGFRTSEVQPAAPGDIRAYDVRTGKLRWSFHTIPHPGESGNETWPTDAWKTGGAANAWAGFALDEERGIVYAPTGSPASDFYGGSRLGDNLFGNTLLALDANTGKRIWHFQAVHHDIWDRDFSSPPALLTLTRDGRRIDAVAQPTKQGFLYVFDRATGEPLFPIVEKAFPSSTVAGEFASRTQPTPSAPEPYARQGLTEDLLTQRTPAAHQWALKRFRELRSAGPFVPLSVGKPTVIFPGFDGGAEWGGPAVDPRAGVIYINSNDVAWTGMLVRSGAERGGGASLYEAHCSACHGVDRKGSPPAFPSLVDGARRLSAAQIQEVVRTGRGRMPPYPTLEPSALGALTRYVMTGRDSARAETAGQSRRADEYTFTGYNKFLDPEGYPAVAPPWGTLNAINLNTGKYLWKIPLGEYPELAAKGVKATGSENYGGPIVTAGGVVFIGATVYDRKIRGYHSGSGQLLWEAELPFAGTATPASYMVGNKQYVVILANNSRNRAAAQGAAYVAFCLP